MEEVEKIKKVEDLTKKKFKFEILKKNRTGDHIWYITDNSKFIKDYKNWKLKKSLNNILVDIIESEKAKKISS